MDALLSHAGLTTAADHLDKAAKQLRRFGALGFQEFSEPAANEIERLAHALREGESNK